MQCAEAGQAEEHEGLCPITLAAWMVVRGSVGFGFTPFRTELHIGDGLVVHTENYLT